MNKLLKRLKEFLSSQADAYAILQLKQSPEFTGERYCSLATLKAQGLAPEPGHYEMVYTAPLFEFSDRDIFLEELYAKFNWEHPEDFSGHSLSIGDVVALKVKGKISCYFVDMVGFKELERFWDSFLANGKKR